jgi:hypothetical protein
MHLLLSAAWLKARRSYHKVMFAYHQALYRDCLDIPMRRRLYRKFKHHESKMTR